MCDLHKDGWCVSPGGPLHGDQGVSPGEELDSEGGCHGGGAGGGARGGAAHQAQLSTPGQLQLLHTGPGQGSHWEDGR